MNSQAAASVVAAVVASAPAWAMYGSQRAANRRHAERISALHAKVDRLTPAAPGGTDKDGGETP